MLLGWACDSGAGRSLGFGTADRPGIFAEEAAGASVLFHLTGSKAEEIDVVMTVDEFDVEKQQALDCYVTYKETIEAHRDGAAGARRTIPRAAVFELYQAARDPPLESLFDGLTGH
jgi:hypothetical protein